MIAETPTSAAPPYPRAHPAAELFPLMAEPELREMADDIAKNGLLEPIVVDDQGTILDGRNRWRASELAGIRPETVRWTGDGSVIDWIVAKNIKRRHLTPSQKAAIAAEMLGMYEIEARERQRQAGAARVQQAERDERGRVLQLVADRPQAGRKRRAPTARDKAAKTLGVGGRSVQKAKTVMKEAPELHAKVKAGAVSLDSAAHQVRRKQREARVAALPPAPPIVERIDVADATHLTEHIGAESVDLIVTSPPYGLDKPYKGFSDPATGWPAFMADWLAEAFAVAKPHGRLALNVPLDTTLPKPRATYAQAIEAAEFGGWTYRFTIVWEEGNTTKGNRSLGSIDSAARPHHVSPVEMIAVFSKGEWAPSSPGQDDITHEQWEEWGRTVWRFAGESNAWEGHPAPFPEELPRRLISYLSRVGDVVLDPFCGSGTTIVIAKRWKREGIGFDISQAYVESARRRLAGVR